MTGQVGIVRSFVFASLMAAMVAAAPLPAKSELVLRSLIPNAALSVDALGYIGGRGGLLQAEVPPGSEVVTAYLYTSSVWDYSPLYAVEFQGTRLRPSDGIMLSPDRNPATTVRFDVTSIVKPVIDSGPGGVYDFSLVEDGNNDGSTLVVAYANAATKGHTALIFDGELATTGDTTFVQFARPYSAGDFTMSLAVTFGAQPSGQYSTLDVITSSNPSSRRLTSCAGGPDDGSFVNGALITAGGVGDSAANPDPHCSGFTFPRADDELYNLAAGNVSNPAPFIGVGDTWLSLSTRNPSNDDNVYGLFISSAFEVVTVPVTEPPTAALMGIAVLGLAALRRRQGEAVHGRLGQSSGG